MELAVLLICIAALVLLVIGILAMRQDLQVIHAAVNSNMTRALDEVTQLHKDVTVLVKERNEARVEASGLAATEQLSSQLIKAVDGVIEQQKLVAQNLAVAQKAVDGVAADLVQAQEVVDKVASSLEESEKRADDVPVEEPPGAASDAASRPAPTEGSD